MPQKKNPDVAELLRGKTGRVYGYLIRILTLMKGTPLAYNKDFQEDKEGLFDTVDTLKKSLVITAKMIEKTDFNLDNIQKHLKSGFLNATDLAEHFVKNQIPSGSMMVGKWLYCELSSKSFDLLSDEDLKLIDERLSISLLPDLTMEGCVNGRTSYGGTAPREVLRQINEGKKILRGWEI